MGIIKDLLLIGGGVAAAWYLKKDRDSSEFNSHKCKDAMLSLLKDTKAAQEAEPKRKNGERVIDESELPEAVRKNMNKNKKD